MASVCVCVCTHAYICMQILLHGYFLLYSLPGTIVFSLLMLSCFLVWEQIMWTIHLKTHVTVSSFLSCLPLWVYIWLWNDCSLLWVFLSKLKTQAACEEVCSGLGLSVLRALSVELMSLKPVSLQLCVIFVYWILGIEDHIATIFHYIFSFICRWGRNRSRMLCTVSHWTPSL